MYIYWFKTFNGEITFGEERVAWNWYSSDGSWKAKPVYLGASLRQDYINRRQTIIDKYAPKVDEVILERKPDDVSTDRWEKMQEKKLAAVGRLRDAEVKAMDEEIIKTLDKSIVPKRQDVYLNVDGSDSNDAKYINMIQNMR